MDMLYDTLGRATDQITTIDGQSWTQSTTYDQYSRVFQQFDATGYDYGTRFHYNSFGYVEKQQEARDGAGGETYYEVFK